MLGIIAKCRYITRDFYKDLLKAKMVVSRKIYLVGVGWFVLSLVCSSLNDIINKYTGMQLHSVEVTFLRFAFGALTLLPVIMYQGKRSIITHNPLVHISRGVLLFLAINAWVYGLSESPVVNATVMSFSIPLFNLVLASMFLKEKVLWQRWLVTIVGFCGIALLLSPSFDGIDVGTVAFACASLFFASLDVINKRFIVEESMTSMLFYSSLITACLAAPAAMYYWQTPTLEVTLLFLVLGASSNLILYFILRAFALLDATAVAPYRYLELPISAVAAFLVFGEVAPAHTWQGAAIIIPCAFFLAYTETRKSAE